MTILANLFFLIQVGRAFSPCSQYFPVTRGLTVNVDLSGPAGDFHGRFTFSVPWVIDFRCLLAPNYVPAYDSQRLSLDPLTTDDALLALPGSTTCRRGDRLFERHPCIPAS